MILTIIYILFSFGFALSHDDGKKWDFWDWVLFALSPVIVPFMVGMTIGGIITKNIEK